MGFTSRISPFRHTVGQKHSFCNFGQRRYSFRGHTTNIETNVHYPTNNSLVFDCIETATRLLKRIKKGKKDDDDRLDEQLKAAKKLNYEINNSKKENLPGLFDPYLSTLKCLF